MAGRVVTFHIDGQQLTARDDQSVLEIAHENHIRIPKLCYVFGLSTYGGCRLCLVEVEGVNKLLPACITKVGEGMQVRTTSERLLEYRRMILELLFAERNHVCSVCVSNGHCELQSLAQALGVDHIRFPTSTRSFRSTRATTVSWWITTAASCARAASACATRSKARIPGM
jgi:bidirectional [NiFe] hydrogenase diaphorase subunit